MRRKIEEADDVGESDRNNEHGDLGAEVEYGRGDSDVEVPVIGDESYDFWSKRDDSGD